MEDTKPAVGIVAQRNALREENAELKAMIADLNRYLNSPKFSVDPTVQVVDVLTRLNLR